MGPVLLAALLVTVPAVAAAADVGDPAPPTLRLPAAVKPLRQTVEMQLDPRREDFQGRVSIDVEVADPVSVVWLNASGIELTEASITSAGREHAVRIVPGGSQFTGLVPEAPLRPGPGVIRARYRGKVNRTDVEGVFAQREEGEWYLFTQFEPLAARRAFPCFDEPGFKIPWQVTLRVPEALVALSNTSPVSTKTVDGEKTLVFAETQPMPSYLVAVAVGPFDVVDAGSAGRRPTPVRIVVPRGRAKDVAWAVESTPKLLTLLEEYFDRAHPYDKLDQVAIPGVGFAMEHPGLVTYGQSLMVQLAGQAALTTQREYASVCAHELAHQWFGNLVTMAWWDDLWLNEAFASWVGEKVLDRYRPEWEVGVTQVRTRSDALRSDSLKSARKIRQPVESEHDAANLFDSITYGKGETILAMFESWLGEEAFRKGVTTYLERHAWGSATASDFLAALSAAAGRDVSAAFSSFIDQTGAPLVAADVRCDGSARAVLRQQPYRRLGSPEVAKTWQVPVCVRLGPAAAETSCGLVSGAEATLPLAACPAWDLPNAGMAGYFRVKMTGRELLDVLAPGRLSKAERVGLLGDVRALVESGDLPASEALAVAAHQAPDPDWQVLLAVAGIVDGVDRHVSREQRPRYAAFVRGLFGRRARSLGWRARPGEDENTRLLRRSVVWRAAALGEDAGLGKEAVALARRWLDDPLALDPDMVDVVLPAAARHGDRALLDALAAEVARSTDRQRRAFVFEALGNFVDPSLLDRALGLLLDPSIDAREAVRIPFASADVPAAGERAYAFTRQHHETLVARLPAEVGAALPLVGKPLCDEAQKADLLAAFKPSATKLPGGPHLLDQAVEAIELCIAERKVVRPSVETFLARR